MAQKYDHCTDPMITTFLLFGFTSSSTWAPTGPRSHGTRGRMTNCNICVKKIIYSTDRNIPACTVPWDPKP